MSNNLAVKGLFGFVEHLEQRAHGSSQPRLTQADVLARLPEETTQNRSATITRPPAQVV